ncbi:MAG TPA: hypothetical protein VID73_00670 [Ktedonobacterales bacterium]|jgi:hypothetical protein
MWDITVPVIGRCRDCGDELGTEIIIRATAEWVERYQRDESLRHRANQAVVRLVVARHGRRCPGPARRPLALAASA